MDVPHISIHNAQESEEIPHSEVFLLFYLILSGIRQVSAKRHPDEK